MPFRQDVDSWLLPLSGDDLSRLSVRIGLTWTVRWCAEDRGGRTDAGGGGDPAQPAEDPREPREQVRKQADEHEHGDSFRTLSEAPEVVDGLLTARLGRKPALGGQRGEREKRTSRAHET